jgi:hypothetical protein
VITALVRNWHKRNTRAAVLHPVEASVSNGGDKSMHVQLRLRSDDKGSFHITLTPDQAEKLIAELTHCAARYSRAALKVTT